MNRYGREFARMNAYERHQKLLHDYFMYYGGKIEDFIPDPAKQPPPLTDLDFLQKEHRCVDC